MRSNKPGSGKKVRRPITPAGPKPSDSGGEEKNEPKVTTLLFAGGLAVFAVMVLAVIVLSFARGDGAKNQANASVQGASAVQVLDAVYLSLFTYGLDKSSIKDQTETETADKTDIKLTIDPADIEQTELSRTLTEKLTELGMDVSGEKELTASNRLVDLFIDFFEKTAVETPKGQHRIAFVIDDCGYSLPLAERLAKLPYQVTMAIIPYTEHGKKTAEIARKYGKTVFLHQPMQPLSYPKTDPGKGAVLLDMPDEEIGSWLEKNVADIGGDIDGFNNHMGSAVTRDSAKMKTVFGFMKQYTDTFVDSYTARDTVAYDECRKAGLKCAINRKFIDNELDYSYIRSKIIEGAEIARDKGEVIMIGHLKEATVDALEKILPELAAAGYTLVSATELTVK